jgi:transcriptional regulator with XRE-family HTH domain
MVAPRPPADRDLARSSASRVGRALRLLRAERGLSQIDLCRRSGLSSSRVSRYESGRTEPTLRTAGRILEALGATWTDFDEALTRTLRHAAGAAAVPAATGPEPTPLLVIGLVCPLVDRGAALEAEATRSLEALERLLLTGLGEEGARGQARRLLTRLARRTWGAGGDGDDDPR